MTAPTKETSKPIAVEPCKLSLEELLAKVTAENRHSEEITDSVGRRKQELQPVKCN